MNRKLILKSPRFVPLGANLAHLYAKSDMTATTRSGLMYDVICLSCDVICLSSDVIYLSGDVECLTSA